jgi:hypothetical protein
VTTLAQLAKSIGLPGFAAAIIVVHSAGRSKAYGHADGEGQLEILDDAAEQEEAEAARAAQAADAEADGGKEEPPELKNAPHGSVRGLPRSGSSSSSGLTCHRRCRVHCKMRHVFVDTPFRFYRGCSPPPRRCTRARSS